MKQVSPVNRASPAHVNSPLEARLIEVETKYSDPECLKQRLCDLEDYEDPCGFKQIGYEHSKQRNAREEIMDIKMRCPTQRKYPPSTDRCWLSKIGDSWFSVQWRALRPSPEAPRKSV